MTFVRNKVLRDGKILRFCENCISYVINPISNGGNKMQFASSLNKLKNSHRQFWMYFVLKF